MSTEKNPLIQRTKIGKFEAIPFDQIKREHFLPAIEKAMEITKANIEKIRTNQSPPSFENTVEALEFASEHLDEVATIYFNLMNSESDDKFKELAQQIAPMLSALNNSILTDPVLFDKVESIYNKRESLNLNQEQARLLELNYKAFVRNGARLSDEDKKKLIEIDDKLSRLSPKFMQNVMNSANSFSLHITDKSELEGLPSSALESAAHAAKRKGLDSGWLFTLQIPSFLPVMMYAKNRELREKMYRAYGARAFKDKFDNQDMVKQIATLRHKRANLLGFGTHAQYVLAERMAEKPTTVLSFLDEIFDAALPTAKEELEEMKNLAYEKDKITDFSAWDSHYYAQILKEKKFNYNEEELRPYFKMENVIDGLFKVANRLYGIKFSQINDIPVYHDDVIVYEVKDKDDSHLGLLYLDTFPRETKRDGAWMTTYQRQGMKAGKVHRPHVSIVANLSPSTDKNPSLLQHSEVKTLFHEFGHALHALLSNCTYSSLASPNVYWDFVELPSQIMENWVVEKDALNLFANHYQNETKMPDELIEKVKKAQRFNAGSMNLRQLSLGYLDMAWHNNDPSDIDDVAAYEDKVIEKTRLLPKVEGRNTSCSFSHIFAGGYSAGYYSYKWAEVLEADAFELFKEKGVFSNEIAESFRNNILARGNTEHPMDIYVKFRGRKPDPEALLKREGLK